MTAATDIRDSREGKDMLITRECDYAVRVIRALSGAERLSVGEICEREEITAPFAYKILKKTSESKARQRLQRSPWRLFHEPDAGGDHAV